MNEPLNDHIVDAVLVFDQYYGYVMVELANGEFHDVDRWFWDERQADFAGDWEAKLSLEGLSMEEAHSRFHENEVRRIRSWV